MARQRACQRWQAPSVSAAGKPAFQSGGLNAMLWLILLIVLLLAVREERRSRQRTARPLEINPRRIQSEASENSPEERDKSAGWEEAKGGNSKFTKPGPT